MRIWSVQDAKTRFDDLLVACESEGPQVIAKRGVEAVVLVPVEQWRGALGNTRPTLKDLLLSDEARFDDLGIPPRGRVSLRTPHEF